MPQRGDVHVNPVTGERAIVRIAPDQTDGMLMVADLHLKPGAAVVGEHVHPVIEERFTVLRGQVGYSLGRERGVAVPGSTLVIPPGVPHDWWNASDDETVVRFEIRPGARFQAMVLNIFGLAQDGKTDKRGLPNILQLALFAREFSDVVYFTRPPRPVQRLLFAFLAPVARLAGYRGSYPEYLKRPPSATVELEP